MQLHRPERNFLHLFLFLVFASTLGWFINTYPPKSLWQFVSFFTLLGITSFSLFQFILCHTQRAILISMGIVTIFILRLLNLRHPAYLLLLFALLLSVEYTVIKMRKTK